jgi:phosphopantetheine--protein transferase-like protein
MFRSLPLADVYLAELPLDCDIGVLESRERMEEINSISNERVKREKYFVFKLLYYALERSFGLRGNKLELKKELYGGWSCGDIYLSLSHSDGALAVAVSRAPIGVDIERVKCPRKKDLARHILNEKELSEYESIPEENREKRLIELWTAKEAIFKSKGLDRFLPTHTDTFSESFVTKSIELKGEYYIFSVATATPERVRVYDKVKLSD